MAYMLKGAPLPGLIGIPARTPASPFAPEVRIMNPRTAFTLCLVAATLGSAALALAHEPSGAIFTTVANGSEVNYNHYPSKDSVYLDGGPGPGAPQTAAGLDDGTYVFQVTDPSGKVLLSTDPARSRRFTVTNGIITGVVADAGQHKTATDLDHNATTVQLMPYLDTPNNGGVYKVWVVTEGDYLLGLQDLGVNTGLDTVDPGWKGGNAHGFIPGHSKTDNFKVGKQPVVEIDTRFYDAVTKQILDGKKITWIDTNGASNTKWSYYSKALDVNHEAHVEGVETGKHTIVIQGGTGYRIDHVYYPDGTLHYGNQSVPVRIQTLNKDLTVYIDVFVTSSAAATIAEPSVAMLRAPVAAPGLALEAANPARGGRMAVAFTLPSDARATLELVDIGGRVVERRDVGALGAGRHTVDLSAGRSIAPGVYLVRVTQGEQSVTNRVSVVR